MFEKKTRDELFEQSLGQPYGVLLDYAEAANAEIDRLGQKVQIIQDEVSNLMSVINAQRGAERVWINSETHEVFPEGGIWFFENQSTGYQGAGEKTPMDYLSPFCKYTLILAEKDFPVPTKPQPLEVKVGKYRWGTKGKTCHILDIGQKYCLYRFGGNSQAVLHQPIETMQRMMQEADARFIGEGDNQ